MRIFTWLRPRVLPHFPISYLALGVGTLALSFAAMYVRWAQAPGVVTGFYRLFLSTLILLPFLAFRKRIIPFRVSWRIVLPPALSGMCMAANFALWNTSLFHTTVANASILGNVTPLWVCIAAWGLFHEHLNQRFWMGLLVIFLGVFLDTSREALLRPHLGAGDIKAFSSSVFSPAYILIMWWGRQRLDSLTYVWINGASASFWMLLIAWVLKYPLIGFSQQTWIVFIMAAIVTQIIGYMAISYSLGTLPASVVSPTLNLQPVLTILLAIPLLKELPNAIQALGCMLVLGGVYLINHSYSQRLASAPPVH